jgi:hypothetical protein
MPGSLPFRLADDAEQQVPLRDAERGGKRTFEGKGGDERSAAGNRMRRDCSGQSNPGNERSGASRRTETIGESAHPGKEMGPIFHGIHSCAHVGGRRVRLTSWRLACLMQVAK